jgi:outer membrane protein assembly factor BamD (BamD/ComL family)
MIRLSYFVLLLLSLALSAHAGDGAITSRHGMEVAQESRAAEAGAETLPDAAVEADADKSMLIGSYYIERRDYTGALTRFKTVVTRYQSSRRVAEALARLTKVYLALGIPSEAQTAAAVLARKFPNNPWTAEAENALRSAGLVPLERP